DWPVNSMAGFGIMITYATDMLTSIDAGTDVSRGDQVQSQSRCMKWLGGRDSNPDKQSQSLIPPPSALFHQEPLLHLNHLDAKHPVPASVILETPRQLSHKQSHKICHDYSVEARRVDRRERVILRQSRWVKPCGGCSERLALIERFEGLPGGGFEGWGMGESYRRG